MATDKDKRKKKDEESPDKPVVNDKRRIDPETGEARPVAGESEETFTDEDLERLLKEAMASAGPLESAEFLDAGMPRAQAESTEAEVVDATSEHLHDLKRVQAEYANYRKRVDRDRFVARELAIGEVLTSVLPVLDDLELARAHGDLDGGPLELVAQKLRTSLERYGLTQIGAVGEAFDPAVHEALAQLTSTEVTVNTIAEVIQPGYMLGERLLRPAKVAVSVPEE